ncbi:MAG: proprotein convertase P-domain-containing protein [Planctomycetota bacterium]
MKVADRQVGFGFNRKRMGIIAAVGVALVFGLNMTSAQVGVEATPIDFGKSGMDEADLKVDIVEAGLQGKGRSFVEWCQTQTAWDAKGIGSVAGPGCPTEGTCDTPSVRNTFIPTGSTPVRTMRIHYNVFANSDGTSPAATQASVDAQMVQLNADFAPSKIQFCYTTEFINNTTYRQFADAEESAMKTAYADSPGTQLNVYVVNIQAGYLGVGTFPWDPASLGTQGGLIIDDNWFGAGQKTLTHEVGHCVGLWHTHHGVSEVTACSACYERADHLNGDTTGDFALDTDPTPTNFNCAGPGGTDSCSATAWGVTDPQNYMGYAPDSCYTEFSSQQFGRMHCWSESVLTAWNCAPVTPTGGCCVGQSCSIQTQANCGTSGGTYLGDGTNCNGTPGAPTTYSGTASLAIPDGGGTGNPAAHTINVTDSYTLGDVNVRTNVTHTWVGDLIITLQHGTTTVTIVDRPGYTGTGFGCSADNYSNNILDDEGTGAIESQCVNNLTSPPNYLPNNALSAFDGQNSSGAWTLRASDSATSDTGTFNNWAVVLSPVGTGPCGAGCTTNPQCDDGLFCNGAETCVSGSCQAGTAPNCDDGVACTTDACNESTDSCTHTANNAACNDGLFCNGAETCNVTLGCQAGSDPCPGQTCNESTDTCSSGSGALWMTFADTATVPGVGTVENEDIVAYDLGTGTWSLIFDGSDVGASAFIIDAVQLLSDGRILLSFTAAGTVGGVAMDDSDILQFTPTSLGSTTAGAFAMLFDGSDVGLTLSDEDVDAIGLTSTGFLVISTTGPFGGTGASGQDEDLFQFNATSYGTNTAGSFVMYFDGSDVGLSTAASEDIDAADLTSSGTILLSTLGAFSVTGVSGTSQDIFEFFPTALGATTAGTYSLFLDLSTVGIDPTENVTSIQLVE